jgi:putative transposase
MQRAIGPRSVITIAGTRWEIVEFHNNIFSMRDVKTDDVHIMSYSEVCRELDVPPIFDRRISETGKLELASKSERERLEEWIPRVEEIIEGKPESAEDYRPGYNPELTTQGQRVDLMVRQLNDAGISVGKRTLERYVAAYKDSGPAGLLDMRTTRKHHPLDGVHSAVLGCIDAMIADRLYKASIPWKVQATNVILMVKEQFPDRDFLIPGRDRLIAAIKEKTKGEEPKGPAKRRRTARNAPDWTYHGMSAIMPGSETQIDNSKYDVRARKPDGTPGSFTLTAMMDKCTHTVLALSVQESGKGAAHAYLLAQALSPAEARPGSDELFNPWVLKGRHLPWASLLDPEEVAKWETRRPVIRIFRIVTDNGRDFTSKVFDSACRQLGIVITRCSTRSPTDKAMIERFFDTLLDQFIAYLPGNTGGDVNRRGKDPDNEELLDIEDLIILLDRWIVQYWQNQPHDALRDPLAPSAKPVSPNVMYASMFPFVGYVPLALAEADYISLMPVDHRTLQRDGIEFHCRQYDSDELRLLRMHTSGDSKLGKDGGEWEIHYRPTDPRKIWVYVPHEDRYIQCHMKEGRFDNPHLSGVWRIAHEFLDNGYVIPSAEADEASASFIKREVAKIRRAEKQKKAAELAEHLAEIQGMGGPATRTTLSEGSPAGDDWDNVPDYPMTAHGLDRPSPESDANGKV